MGIGGWFFFGERDAVLIDEICKIHKADKETVEKHYKEMLKAIQNELQGEVED